ncbi:hypothetical protein MNBD_GAMMA12-3615 [hydrothermal vent metagenome]|uniref:Uncharacterized protein n=1 Tax=hydrothermal vent metagenome TaxID=652676 RepID=A0A3B0Y2Q7_9ZZZZ
MGCIRKHLYPKGDIHSFGDYYSLTTTYRRGYSNIVLGLLNVLNYLTILAFNVGFLSWQKPIKTIVLKVLVEVKYRNYFYSIEEYLSLKFYAYI